MTELTISDWRLLQITMEDIGPFRGPPRTIRFRGVKTEETPDPDPASLFMLLAINGHGKTTILESIHGLFGLLDPTPSGRFADPSAQGRVQLDVRGTWTIDGRTQTVILSMWTGSTTPLVTWTSQVLDTEGQASVWATLGLNRGPGGVVLSDETNELGLTLFRAVQAEIGRPPTALFGLSQEMPTVILFPADRALRAPTTTRVVARPRNWTYQPAQTFGSDGPAWDESIDNLFVWLEWLDDGRIGQLLEYLNERLFQDQDKVLRPPNREDLAAYISTSAGEQHSLMGLSHGERALLQLYVRIVCQMSRNTIILIDEIETHLHSKWMNRLFQALKALLQTNPRLSIVFTTHSRELVRVFDHTLAEPGLIKGGYLVEEGLS